MIDPSIAFLCTTQFPFDGLCDVQNVLWFEFRSQSHHRIEERMGRFESPRLGFVEPSFVASPMLQTTNYVDRLSCCPKKDTLWPYSIDDEHGIAISTETILFFYSEVVCIHNQLMSSESGRHHQ